MVKQIWRVFCQAQVDLFATQRNVPSGTLYFIRLHWGWMPWYRRGRRFVCTLFPDRSAPGVLARVRRNEVSLLLVAPFWPGRVWFSDLISLLDGSPWEMESSLPPGDVEVVGVAPEGAQLIASGLSTEVVETILQSRAPSTRKTVRLEVETFTSWCGDRQLDPVNCPIGTVLEFLQARLSAGLTHSTLKVHVVAIRAYHTSLGGQSVGRYPLFTCFLDSLRKLYALKWNCHFMVRGLSARRSQLPDWYSSGVRAGLFLHRVNPLHLEGYVAAIRPTTPLLVDNQWAYTPWLHISSTAVCMVGEPPLKTRKLYTLKCSTSWCGGHQLDPANCPSGTVLEFVQVCSSAGLTHSTLKAYVAALLAYRAPLGGLSVGRHPLVTRFLQRLRPPARRRMLFGGSGCYSIASSPLLSPLGDQDSLLKSWPSGRRPRPLSHSVFLSP